MSTSNSDELHINIDAAEYIEDENSSDDKFLSLPPKSKLKYLSAYETFLKWKNSKNCHSFSENVFLAYFDELSNKYSPSSLWCIYSMLKSTVITKNNVDIKTYRKLTEFIKGRSDGYISRQSKELSQSDVEKFLNEAPDSRYLATKVALIFGIIGGCTVNELNEITTKDVETHGEILLVKIANTRNKIPRKFTIDGPYYEIVKKYQDLRSSNAKNDRFFQNFQKGKCTAQPIGVNKFGAMPREIAKYLGLPEADMYTGHSFRRTSAKMLADTGIRMLQIKRQQYHTVAEDSVHKEASISANIKTEINLEPETKKFCPESRESTSPDIEHTFPDIEHSDTNDDPLYFPNSSNFYENVRFKSLPTFTEENENNDNINNTNTITQSVKMPTKTIHYHFQNCTFTNCFNNSNLSTKFN